MLPEKQNTFTKSNRRLPTVFGWKKSTATCCTKETRALVIFKGYVAFTVIIPINTCVHLFSQCFLYSELVKIRPVLLATKVTQTSPNNQERMNKLVKTSALKRVSEYNTVKIL